MHYLLFTTTACPKCPEFKAFVTDNILFKGEMLDENHEDFQAKAAEFEITMAPLLIVFSEYDEVLLKASEIVEVEDFINSISNA